MSSPKSEYQWEWRSLCFHCRDITASKERRSKGFWRSPVVIYLEVWAIIRVEEMRNTRKMSGNRRWTGYLPNTRIHCYSTTVTLAITLRDWIGQRANLSGLRS